MQLEKEIAESGLVLFGDIRMILVEEYDRPENRCSFPDDAAAVRHRSGYSTACPFRPASRPLPDDSGALL